MARILFVSHTSELGCGPVFSLLKLIKYLRGKYDLSVLAPAGGKFFEVLDQLGIPWYLPGRYGLRFWSIPFLCYLMSGFDLVYGNNLSSGIRNALIAAKLMGKPFLWHIREVLDENSNPKVVRFLKYADRVIVVSEYCASRLRNFVPLEKVHLVYNGVDIEDFSVGRLDARKYLSAVVGGEEAFRVLSIGRVNPVKGQHYLVEVAHRVLQRFPGVEFLVLGRMDDDPGYVSFIGKRISELGLGQRVKFLGLRDDVSMFLRGCDIYVHTSCREANPRAVLEAMASGLPVVAFAADGLSEVVLDGRTGFLVPYADVGAMVEVLERILAAPLLFYRMGEEGKRRVSSLFSAQDTAYRVGEIISVLV